MTGELTASADVQVRTALPNSLAFGGHCVSQILRPATTARRRGDWLACPTGPANRADVLAVPPVTPSAVSRGTS